MKSWKITAPHTIKLEESQRVRPKGYVKVKLYRTAITPMDISVFSGKLNKFPIVPCRCAVGLVSEADEASRLRVGEKVLLSAYASCNQCEQCKQHKYSQCENIVTYGIDKDGFLSDFAILPERDVYLLPEHINEEDALFSDYIAIANKTVESLNIDKGEYVVLVGATPLNIIIAQLVIYYQAIPILIDFNDDILKITTHYGIFYTVCLKTEDVKRRVVEITGGRMAEHVVYATDSNEPTHNIFGLAMQGGKVAIVGYDYDDNFLTADIREVLSSQLKIIGICEAKSEFVSALNILANNAVIASPFITKRVNFLNVDNMINTIYDNNEKNSHIIVEY